MNDERRGPRGKPNFLSTSTEEAEERAREGLDERRRAEAEARRLGILPRKTETEGKAMNGNIGKFSVSAEWKPLKKEAGYSSMKLEYDPATPLRSMEAWAVVSGEGPEDAEIEVPLHALMHIRHLHESGAPIDVHHNCREHPSEYHFDVSDRMHEPEKVTLSIRSRTGGVRTCGITVPKKALVGLVDDFFDEFFRRHGSERRA